MNFRIDIDRVCFLRPGETPDVAFVPPLVRRRLSPLQRVFFRLARDAGAEAAPLVVFASRDGEDSLSRRIVADFREDGSVSPQRFSASVYNAAPGAWSILNGNTAPYTAVAAGEDTLECGLLELAGAPRGAVLVYGEETGGGYGAALRVGAEGAVLSAVPAPAPGRSPLSFGGLLGLCGGGTPALEGKWLRLQTA